jgi:lipopolysaccharide/colanic/teichoic acid biosynthesis glycosyltransferase
VANAERLSDYSSTIARNQQPRTAPPLISAGLFRGALIRERKRADRSNQMLALLLISPEPGLKTDYTTVWLGIADALRAAKRETDVIGWYDDRQAIGLIVPEIPASGLSVPDELYDRVQREIGRQLDSHTASRVSIQMHVHPDPALAPVEAPGSASPFVGEVRDNDRQRKQYDIAKRALDLTLSAALLAMLSPLFLVLAALVKLTSRGPVFFRQERVGQMMKPFKMLKFRTMYVNTDHAIHHQFVSSFIKSGGQAAEAGKKGLFKIANDPRVTPIGRILRRTSLDELPQFWNVLRGEMSLVGPRPPLAYEVEQYQSWHRRRVLEAKPGLTGLWQVTGRSRTTFDEMVRLDLRYARSHSVWTDIKILLATPRAVISGKGAC